MDTFQQLCCLDDLVSFFAKRSSEKMKMYFHQRHWSSKKCKIAITFLLGKLCAGISAEVNILSFQINLEAFDASLLLLLSVPRCPITPPREKRHTCAEQRRFGYRNARATSKGLFERVFHGGHENERIFSIGPVLVEI